MAHRNSRIVTTSAMSAADATAFAGHAAAFSPKWREAFVAAVERAAAYHDLGKLDELFQEVLRHNRKNKHGFNHVEAGTAHLLRLKQFEAAFTAYAHHIGLPSIPKEKAKAANKQNLAFATTANWIGFGTSRMAANRRELWQATLSLHHQLVSSSGASSESRTCTGLVRRLALSCLVDADHSRHGPALSE